MRRILLSLRPVHHPHSQCASARVVAVQVVDCGSVIAHIFDGQEARMQYNLERLWAAPPSAELDTDLDSSYALQRMS